MICLPTWQVEDHDRSLNISTSRTYSTPSSSSSVPRRPLSPTQHADIDSPPPSRPQDWLLQPVRVQHRGLPPPGQVGQVGAAVFHRHPPHLHRHPLGHLCRGLRLHREGGSIDTHIYAIPPRWHAYDLGPPHSKPRDLLLSQLLLHTALTRSPSLPFPPSQDVGFVIALSHRLALTRSPPPSTGRGLRHRHHRGHPGHRRGVHDPRTSQHPPALRTQERAGTTTTLPFACLQMCMSHTRLYFSMYVHTRRNRCMLQACW